MHRTTLTISLCVALSLSGCKKKNDGTDAGPASANLQGVTVRGGTDSVGASNGNGEDGGERHVAFTPTVVERAARGRNAERTARADEHISVAAGRYHVGSTPGEIGRDPATEADGNAVEMTAFDIDALPYPNDPAQPPRTGVTRDEAQRLCSARGRRLCREIEWERACKGPNETIFPNGDEWDAARCSGENPGQCASGYGAMLMGTRFAEWTADDIADRAVIRGAANNARFTQHRCSSRRTALATQSGLEVAFRCCGGTRSTVEYPREVSRPPFREQPMNTAQLAEIVATIPELNRVREGLTMFSVASINEVMNHGATSVAMHPEASFTVQPLRWSPTFGEELLVFTATSTVGSFVAALWVLPTEDGRGERYKHAASFILAGDRVAMTLAHTRTTREEVQWSACWNCGGEHGVITYDRENARAIAVQR
jgi:formylglycine-generating enzyme required for sulfatase activity